MTGARETTATATATVIVTVIVTIGPGTEAAERRRVCGVIGPENGSFF